MNDFSKNTMNLHNVTDVIKGASTGLSFGLLFGMILTLGTVCSDGGLLGMILGIVVFLPFCGFPQIVSLILSSHVQYPFSQLLLLTASLFYGILFFCVMYNTFFVNLDHLNMQNALIIFFVGICFLPVLLPLWISAAVLNRHYAKPSEP